MDIPQNWTFENTAVASGFDRHVREQLPWYDIATNSITHFARHYIPERGLVYDIGASTGNIGRAIASVIEARNAELVGIEPAEEMLLLYEAPGKVDRARAEDYDYKPFDFAVLFLCLMFVPYCERSSLVSRLVDACRPGGAIIIFDKMEPEAGYLSTVLYRLTLAGKLASGTSPSEIVAKELSLAGVQRALSPSTLPESAKQWFRFGDFAGFIIEK